MNLPIVRDVFQNAWVVDDLETACLAWIDQFGVGPFFLSEYRKVFEQVTYRGKPAELEMRVGLAQAGSVQIELIQPLTEKCAYRDSVPSGTGFHHMCVWTHDFARDHEYLESLNYVAANTGQVRDVQFGYYDTRAVLGCMLEIVTYNEPLVARFQQVADAAANWDGQDPIRQY